MYQRRLTISRIVDLLMATGIVLGILCFLALCSAVWAKDKDEYHTGKVEKFKSVVDPGTPSVLSRNIVTIRDGSEQYTAGYVVHTLGHHPKDLVVGQDVNYRVSGDKLFLKTTDGKP